MPIRLRSPVHRREPSTSHSFRLIAALACSLRLCGSVRIFIYREISVNRSTRMFPEAFDENYKIKTLQPPSIAGYTCCIDVSRNFQHDHCMIDIFLCKPELPMGVIVVISEYSDELPIHFLGEITIV